MYAKSAGGHVRRFRALARRSLDQRLGPLVRAQITRPPRGWLRAIREALGMTTSDVATRMGVVPSRITALEQEELTGGIKLATLDRAARALNCRLIYALVPEKSLEEMVQSQARRKAAAQVGQISHHMRLEDQEVGEAAARAYIDDLAAELIDRRGLWREPTTRP